jgi:hypothetical protein
MSSLEHRGCGAGRTVSLLLALIAVLGASVLGCGNRTELPTETPGGIIPATGTYAVTQVWQGFEAASDLILTRGSQVFVAFPERGEVVGYFRTKVHPTPNGIVIESERPTFLAEGAGRELVVADVDSTGCGLVRIIDLSVSPPTEVASFCDTTWADIGGLAADDSSFVYVSDRERNLVRKYDRSGRFVIELAIGGTGIGFVDSPGGLHWQPELLLLADTGKAWAQGINPREQEGFFRLSKGAADQSFVEVSDVTGDEEENVYVADVALGAVFKYSPGDPEPKYDLRVDENAVEGTPGHLTTPIAVSANATLAFVLDRDAGKIVTFELDR